MNSTLDVAANTTLNAIYNLSGHLNGTIVTITPFPTLFPSPTQISGVVPIHNDNLSSGIGNFSDWPAATLFKGILVVIACLVAFVVVTYIFDVAKNCFGIMRSRMEHDRKEKERKKEA